MWTSPVPIPSRIPSTPWKTDTRTAGSGLPSSFSFMSTQRRPHNSGAVRHLQQEHPRRMLLFLSASPHQPARRRGQQLWRNNGPPAPHQPARRRERRQDRPAKSGKRAQGPSTPRFPALAFRTGPGLSCGCTIFFRKRACRTDPFRLPPPGSPILPLRPRPSGLRPLSPRAKISFCPCPAAGTGAPARPRASASTVPAGDAVQTLPRIIP